MFDKFKEFIGIDDNYDDYDEEQAYYEDEEKEDLTSRESYASLLDDNQSSFESNTKTYESEYSGSSNDSYNYSSDYLDSNYSSNDYKPTSSRYQRPSKRGDRVGSMTDNNFTSRSSLRISIQEPLDYEQDAPSVINDIINKKVVVLNLEMVDADMRRRIFDFVSGAVYALDGTVEKVTKGIFVITPNGVEIDNTVTEQISEGNYNQL
ncbi:cell division protein SepF [Anaerococcus provencensis]|uniref:cell division protein SepF n=1 Tax=Anaerococcus provencensis TaxID=938293 RepID=UPI0003122908|nr:cell division protein SepF [Anaerococcus provencensis]